MCLGVYHEGNGYERDLADRRETPCQGLPCALWPHHASAMPAAMCSFTGERVERIRRYAQRISCLSPEGSHWCLLHIDNVTIAISLIALQSLVCVRLSVAVTRAGLFCPFTPLSLDSSSSSARPNNIHHLLELLTLCDHWKRMFTTEIHTPRLKSRASFQLG